MSKGVKMKIQGFQIQQDFYLFNLGGADMVLDMSGLILCVRPWRQHTIKINSRGKVVCLSGDPSLSRTLVSLKSLFATWWTFVLYQNI